jgi:outer membrane protein OmpA-like peptidoglycan-associated protein
VVFESVRRSFGTASGWARCDIVCTIVALLFSRPALADWQTPGAIEQVQGSWQTPGKIQEPHGPWQTPGAIQIPKGIQAIHPVASPCEQRLIVGSDALFDFDRSNLRPDAQETLTALEPMIRKSGGRIVAIDGYTDSVGSIEYNQSLSEQRAQTVKSWLVGHGDVPDSTPIKGFGKRQPIAPNSNPDGTDNPNGRQQNRRVEILMNTCK